MARKNTNQDQQATEAKGPDFIAFHVSGEGKKSYWTRIGAAWKHKDGEGMNLQIDLVPIGGGTHIDDGGISLYGGNGGAAANATSGVDGTQLGGGGGATRTGPNAGNGGAGRCNVTVF